jgi:exopolyphosphatase/pppGpp-phosphohydrolase
VSKDSFIGVVDIGSNTVSLSIYDTSIKGRDQRVGETIRIPCRLIKGLNGNATLDPDSKALTINVFAEILNGNGIKLISKLLMKDPSVDPNTISRFQLDGLDVDNIQEIIHAINERNKGKVTTIYVAGTEALRRTMKRERRFIRELKDIFGHPVKILSGHWEAKFQAEAILKRAPPHPGKLHVFGARGGGSMQFAILLDGKILKPLSFAKKEGLTVDDGDKIREYLEKELKPLKKELGKRRIDVFDTLSSEWRWVSRMVVSRCLDIPINKDLKIHKLQEKHGLRLNKLQWKDDKKELLEAINDPKDIMAQLWWLSRQKPDYFRQESMPAEIQKRAESLALSALVLYHTLDILRPKEIRIPSASLRDGIAWISQTTEKFSANWKNRRVYAHQPAP